MARPRKRARRGAGSVLRRPDGTWRAYLPSQSGHRPSRSGFETRQAAEAWQRAELQRQANLTDGASAARPLLDYLQSWLARHEARLAPRTVSAYLHSLKLFESIGGLRVADLKRQHVQTALGDLARQGYGPQTLRIARNTLASALEELVPEALSSNPAKRVKLPGREKREPPAYDARQAAALERASQDTPAALLVPLALRTGLRIGELLGLQWSDVDWQARTLRVERQRPQTGLQTRPTKTRETRTLPLDDVLYDLLRAHLPEQVHRGGWILLSTIGTPPNYNTTRRWLQAVCRAAGVPYRGPHALRHTFATLALQSGIDIIEVSRALGHATPAITLGVYAHWVGERRRSAVAGVAEALGAPVRPAPTRPALAAE